jgi:hypothetical protein
MLMRTPPLGVGVPELDVGRGYRAIVDEELLPYLERRGWHVALRKGRPPEVQGRHQGRQVRLAVLVARAGPGERVVHRNGNHLDCRRDNLEVKPRAPPRRPTGPSGMPGAHWNEAGRGWLARPMHRGHRHYLGSFQDMNDAVEAVVRFRAEWS